MNEFNRKDYYIPKEAAKYLGKDYKTVLAWCHKNTIENIQDPQHPNRFLLPKKEVWRRKAVLEGDYYEPEKGAIEVHQDHKIMIKKAKALYEGHYNEHKAKEKKRGLAYFEAEYMVKCQAYAEILTKMLSEMEMYEDLNFKAKGIMEE